MSADWYKKYLLIYAALAGYRFSVAVDGTVFIKITNFEEEQQRWQQNKKGTWCHS